VRADAVGISISPAWLEATTFSDTALQTGVEPNVQFEPDLVAETTSKEGRRFWRSGSLNVARKLGVRLGKAGGLPTDVVKKHDVKLSP
jgi:hypothetical protein